MQVLTEIPAGVESGWHQHPGEEVGYILAGTVQMDIEEQPRSRCTPATLPDPAAHAAQRDSTSDPRPGRMLSTYIVEAGEPLATFVR